VTVEVDVVDEQVLARKTDTGIGIETEQLPRVFDRFFRTDDERVRDITGTGLGLGLTRDVVRLHQGDLAVESELTREAPSPSLCR